MCGRYTLHSDPSQIESRFAVIAPGEYAPRYNIAPTEPVAAVRDTGQGRTLDHLRWGLVPSWADDPKVGARLINARLETLAEKPTFRNALRRRRCLIPADGFYEWKEADNPDEGGKTPYYIRRANGGLFAFAGLWDHWTSADGAELSSCAIITTAPNALMASIHDRMPVILRPEDEAAWLSPEEHAPGDLLALLAPWDAAEWERFPVSRRVNRAGVEGPELIAPS